MKVTAILVALGALGITSASAQVLLSGEYQCVQNCVGPGVAHVTQNGFELNLVNEIGQPSRAWIDYPGHIWVQYWNEGAVYTPDGMTISSIVGACGSASSSQPRTWWLTARGGSSLTIREVALTSAMTACVIHVLEHIGCRRGDRLLHGCWCK